jgi:ABC-type oligopeptide transport system substrate-binding subunit
LADTILLDAPDTLADLAQEDLRQADQTEELVPEETTGFEGSETETSDEGDLDPEALRQELEKLRKEREADQYRFEQSKRDIRAQLEREAADKARQDEEYARAQRLTEEANQYDLGAFDNAIHQVVMKAHKDFEDGRTEKFEIPVPVVRNITNRLLEVSRFRAARDIGNDWARTMGQWYPDYRPSIEWSEKFVKARDTGNLPELTEAMKVMSVEMATQKIAPELRTQWEQERTQREAEAAEVDKERATRKAATAKPAPMSPGGAPVPRADIAKLRAKFQDPTTPLAEKMKLYEQIHGEPYT